MRVLLVRAGALGDLLLLRRAVAALQRLGHQVGLLAPSGPSSALLGPGLSEVRALLDWDDPRLAALLAGGDPEPAVAEQLACYDLAVCYSNSVEARDGLRRLIAEVRGHPPLPPPHGPHVSLWNLEPVRHEASDEPSVPSLVPTAAESAEVRPLLDALGREFPALHPGSGAARKNWSLDGFADLARGWSRRGPWLLVEGPADAEAAARLRRIDNVVEARSLAPRRLAALLAHAGVYVGNDSGVTHLAAAAGAATLALFGPTDPRQWAPVGGRVRVLRAPRERLEELTLDEVREAADSLGRARAAGS